MAKMLIEIFREERHIDPTLFKTVVDLYKFLIIYCLYII